MKKSYMKSNQIELRTLMKAKSLTHLYEKIVTVFSTESQNIVKQKLRQTNCDLVHIQQL